MPLLQALSIPYTHKKFCISILSWLLLMLYDDFHIQFKPSWVKNKASLNLTEHIKKTQSLILKTGAVDKVSISIFFSKPDQQGMLHIPGLL